ncbi:MAG: ribosomal protein S18-alanine N-acetyltransferase [Deltaproteobacteria bacterium]|nr:ribosomal protein S18-alanine N-acetyltransferase [Deltaproteobacteria bacterium]
MNISEVRLSDFSDMMEIERLSFPEPWDIDTFLATYTDPRCKVLSARVDDAVVGYCLATDMRDILHVLNLAVHPGFRRRGIAKKLVGEMVSYARSTAKKAVLLEVRVNNLAARSLYTSMGFRHVCTWKGYYTDTGEDASVMIMRTGDNK